MSQERLLGEDGNPRKTKENEDPFRMGLVLEWVYGTIVSTAEKARDSAKKPLGRLPSHVKAEALLPVHVYAACAKPARAYTIQASSHIAPGCGAAGGQLHHHLNLSAHSVLWHSVDVCARLGRRAKLLLSVLHSVIS